MDSEKMATSLKNIALLNVGLLRGGDITIDINNGEYIFIFLSLNYNTELNKYHQTRKYMNLQPERMNLQ